MSGEALLAGNEPREWRIKGGQLIELHPHGRCIYSRERLEREIREHRTEIARRQVEVDHLLDGMTAWHDGVRAGQVEEFRAEVSGRAEATDTRPGVVPVPGTVAEGLDWRE